MIEEITQLQRFQAVRRSGVCNLADFDELVMYASRQIRASEDAKSYSKEVNHWCIELDIDWYWTETYLRRRQELNK